MLFCSYFHWIFLELQFFCVKDHFGFLLCSVYLLVQLVLDSLKCVHFLGFVSIPSDIGFSHQSWWVFSQFEFWVLLQFFLKFCPNFTFWILSHLKFLCLVSVSVFEFCHILSFWVLCHYYYHHTLRFFIRPLYIQVL